MKRGTGDGGRWVSFFSVICHPYSDLFGAIPLVTVSPCPRVPSSQVSILVNIPQPRLGNLWQQGYLSSHKASNQLWHDHRHHR